METLLGISEHLEECAELNNDLLKLYEFVIVLYARNVFKHNSNWKRMDREFFVDYSYIRETNCEKDLLNIQCELRNYAKILKIFCFFLLFINIHVRYHLRRHPLPAILHILHQDNVQP